jgi:hypothetical protein
MMLANITDDVILAFHLGDEDALWYLASMASSDISPMVRELLLHQL